MQLDLFETYENKKSLEELSDLVSEKANKLLFMLNEGRKKKEMYEPQWICQHEDLVVFIASTKDKDAVGNILDLNGNTPKEFPVNWRNLNIIKHELATYKPN